MVIFIVHQQFPFSPSFELVVVLESGQVFLHPKLGTSILDKPLLPILNNKYIFLLGIANHATICFWYFIHRVNFLDI